MIIKKITTSRRASPKSKAVNVRALADYIAGPRAGGDGEKVEHRGALKVPDDERACPKCGSHDLRPVGAGKVSVVLDYVPGHFRRRQHIRETLACTCGDHIVTAPGPDHSVEGARYGDSFRAFGKISVENGLRPS